MTLILERFVPPFALTLERFGPDASITALAQSSMASVAAVIGPAGPAGPAGSGAVRIDATLAATWILPHNLGRVPIVDLYLVTGEQVIANINATTTIISVEFATPQIGFVIAA